MYDICGMKVREEETSVGQRLAGRESFKVGNSHAAVFMLGANEFKLRRYHIVD